MNAASAYKSLPKKNKMLIFSKNDHVIDSNIASVYSAMKSDFKKEYKYDKSKESYKTFKKTCMVNGGHCTHLISLHDQSEVPMVKHIKCFIQKEKQPAVAAAKKQKRKLSSFCSPRISHIFRPSFEK